MKLIKISNGRKTIALIETEHHDAVGMYNDITEHVAKIYPNITLTRINHDGIIEGFDNGEWFEWAWEAKDKNSW